MEHPVPDFHGENRPAHEKSPAFLRRPDLITRLKSYCSGRSVTDQPRVRERIMKLSKVYSATCHHRYWSER